MEKFVTPAETKVIVNYSDDERSVLVKAIRPTLFHQGESYYAVFGQDKQTSILGKGVSGEAALLDWEKNLKQLLTYPKRRYRDLIKSIIITYMAYVYEMSPAKTDNIINSIGFKLKEVERYHLYKREPALMDRIYEILKRLGAEDEYLKVVRAMQQPTRKFLQNVDGKIKALKGECEELNSIILIPTGEISYERLFQRLDAWTLDWDKRHASGL
jgi:hypothetical protein